MRKLVVISGVFCFSLLAGCFSSSSVEVSRTSNDATFIDAVVAERATGSVGTTPTEIYLVSKGAKLYGDPIFRSDSVVGLDLEWANATQLIIHADEARVFLVDEKRVVYLGADNSIDVHIVLDIKKRK